jgi:hypothetical protein
MALGVHGDFCVEIEGLKGCETDAVTCRMYIVVLIRAAGW